jgi:hypothetical protein
LTLIDPWTARGLMPLIAFGYINRALIPTTQRGAADMPIRAWKPLPLVAVAVATLLGGVAVMKVRAADPQPPASVTIFVNKSMSGASLATALNKEHARWNDKGYTFAAMDSYIEDGDLQGMWVTYTKRP